MDNNELKHYGVLGMRWGVRKRRRGSGDSDDSVKARTALRKNINEMSNKELQDANQRMRLEQEHKDLVRKVTVGRKSVDAMKAFTSTVASLAGAHMAATKLSSSYKSAVDKVGNRIIKDLAEGLRKPLA